MKMLVSLAALAALTLGIALPASATPLLTPDALEAIREAPEVRIVDIRPPDAYAEGHIPGAVSAPYAQWRGPADNPGKLPTIDQLTALVQGLGIDENSHVVVSSSGADSTDFGASARVYWTLKYLGLTQLSILNGGQKAWDEAGLAHTREATQVASTGFVAQPVESIVITTADLAQRVGDDRTQLVDARPLDFYLGKVKAPTARLPGTIRGAVNLENDRWFEPGTARFVSVEKARAIADELLPEQSDETVSFCNTGHWAATDWFALSEVVGRPNVRLYPESMAEWSQDSALPMDHVPGRGTQILNKLKEALG